MLVFRLVPAKITSVVSSIVFGSTDMHSVF